MKKFFSLALILLSTHCFAEEECISSCECCDPPHSGLFLLRHKEPGGIGYSRGYTSADLLYAYAITPCWSTYLDMRGHVFNNGKWATNLGAGLRFWPGCQECVYGMNVYWDWSETDHSNFHQVGIGLEYLRPCWDLQLNGYIPVGRKKKNYRTGFEEFQGNEAIFFQKSEFSMWGLDLSFGSWLYECSWMKVRSLLGAYFFQGYYSERAGGARLTAEIHFWDRVVAEGHVSYDNQFKWIGQGELSIRFPFGPCLDRGDRPTNCCASILSLEERLVSQPERFEIVVTTTHKKKGRARNPFTGELMNFFFVNNLANSQGTFESPFPTLLQAVNASSTGDAIYVFPGDNSTNGLSDVVNLKDFQLLASAETPFEVDTRFGRMEIPAFASQKPKLGNQVVLANQNLVSGFDITLTGNDAITGTSVTAPIVQSCVLNVTTGNGVRLIDSTGVCIIQDCLIAAEASGAFFTNCMGDFRILRNVVNAETNPGTNTGAILAEPFFGIMTVEDNWIRSDQIGIHMDDLFDGEFRAKGNIINNPNNQNQIVVEN